MAKGRKRRKGETFETEVRRRFGPLAEQFGLIEVPADNRFVGASEVDYSNGRLRYDWSCDGWEDYMFILVILELDGFRHVVGLKELVAATRSAGDQPLLDNCRSWLVLQRAVESHTQWVERLHPRLTAPDAADFVVAAGGSRRSLSDPGPGLDLDWFRKMPPADE
ncbi:hypothetical protein GCM10022243_19160 [Saccharothrix violaceirubra]|uniref:Uncharacterized protein n=1 Tax=Saccharothrix violaceirubra TaxID=413306 RepID=A0A7W7WVK4_9PSEU|nr:hypothetical protein [Saccharothrix violaceirubra]MBB4965176.1 hypothetical protein [Saccharothrix violaceirubra]